VQRAGRCSSVSGAKARRGGIGGQGSLIAIQPAHGWSGSRGRNAPRRGVQGGAKAPCRRGMQRERRSLSLAKVSIARPPCRGAARCVARISAPNLLLLFSESSAKIYPLSVALKDTLSRPIQFAAPPPPYGTPLRFVPCDEALPPRAPPGYLSKEIVRRFSPLQLPEPLLLAVLSGIYGEDFAP